MDRGYYQIIREAHDISDLALAVVQNADYKATIKAVTDPLVVDVIKDIQRLNRTLREVIKRQEMASDKNATR